MARTSTLATMRAEVRARADIENDPHVTDAEVDRFINQSIADIQAEMVQQSEDDFVTSRTIATIAGTEAYRVASAVPEALSDLYKLISVDFAVTADDVRHMRKWTWPERARYLSTLSWSSYGVPVSYRLVGDDTLRFLPVPDAVYQVTVWYVPAPVVLTSDTDTYDGRAGWEEWVVLDAAIKCKMKSEEDFRDLERQRDARMARILPAMATKDHQPDRVQDVTGRNRDRVGDWWAR